MSVDVIARALALTVRPRPYLGLIASRLHIPSLVNASYRQLTFRRWHVARDTVARVQVALPNWVANTTVSEGGSGGTARFRAAIERIDGTIQPLTWAGVADSPLVADGEQTPLSDALTLTRPLRSGEWFAVRGFGEFAGAIVLHSLADSAVGAAGDGVEFAMSGLVDKTLDGTISGAQTSVGFGACLIVGETRRASVALFGDSRVKGGASSPGIDSADASGDLGELARSIGPRFGYVNGGTASERLNQFLANHRRRAALAAYASHVVANYGVNDLIANRSASDILTDIAAFAALPEFAGKPVAWTTIGPRSTSTDGWTTIANQTPFSQDPARRTLNATLRARRVPGLADVFDCAGAYESAPDSGRFTLGDAGEALTADGLHLLAAGTRRIQRSGMVDAGRIAR